MWSLCPSDPALIAHHSFLLLSGQEGQSQAWDTGATSELRLYPLTSEQGRGHS